MKKPDATTVITQENFKETVWGLPATDLLYVGRATGDKLHRRGIDTIGQLARTDPENLRRILKSKWGIYLWQFANGLEQMAVSPAGSMLPIKSVGNSQTTPRDLTSPEDIKITTIALAESVAERLRDHNLKSKTVQVSIRYSDLFGFDRQARLEFPTHTTDRIYSKAYELILKNWNGQPIRSLGVRAVNLHYDEFPQLCMLPDQRRDLQQEQLELALDHLRLRNGHFVVQRGIMLTDPLLSSLDAKADHIIHPVAFYHAKEINIA